MDRKQAERLEKLLNKMDPGAGNADAEVLSAARSIHRILNQNGLISHCAFMPKVIR